MQSRLKKDNSIVTEADLKVDDFIRKEILKFDSKSGILTEESEDSKDRLAKEGVYVCDPLDGSKDFKQKEEDFCFLLAYVQNGTPTLGVVYEPKKRRMFFGAKGDGAFMSKDAQQPKILPKLAPINWSSAIVGSPKNYEGDKYTKLYELMGIPQQRLIFSGCMGTRMMQAAMQQIQIILGYTKGLKEWDIAAGHVILEERGFSITDIFGKQLKYNQFIPQTHQGILVVHPSVKATALEKLAQCYDKLQM